MNDIQHVVGFGRLRGDDGVHGGHQAVTVTRGEEGGSNVKADSRVGQPLRVVATGGAM